MPGNTLLQPLNQTQSSAETIERYQQYADGLPVIGAQIMLGKQSKLVNGHLLDNIQLNTHPTINAAQAIELAKKSWLQFNSLASFHAEVAELQIRSTSQHQLKLVYLVSFKITTEDARPAWPFFIVDAQSGAISKQWNNIQYYLDAGPGGNEKVHEYWYGKDGLPSLDVVNIGGQCIMDTANVKLVHLGFVWDWSDNLSTAYQYACDNNQEDKINGAFSPINDAYYFGHLVVAMYSDWYGVHALQYIDGEPMQLVMRVHFGQRYDNAFWDGQYMSFGDGNQLYPLVSLDIAGHEVTHGFTEQHSGLEYHDESGALNESLSDMAGQASRAYLLEKHPDFYRKAYLQKDQVTWGIGETVVPDSFGKALRFMDFPSSDGSSADCLDKNLARSSGAYCAISYPEVLTYAKTHIPNPQERQSFIVHAGSGVFNKAFYLLSKNTSIKKAYQIMIAANTKYWTPVTNFSTGACGVLYAAKDLHADLKLIKSIFNQVGVSTSACSDML